MRRTSLASNMDMLEKLKSICSDNKKFKEMTKTDQWSVFAMQL